MSTMSRRTLLAGGGALFTSAFLAACGGTPTAGPGAAGGSGGDLRWWDHFSALQKFHKSWAAQESKALGVNIAYTYNDVPMELRRGLYRTDDRHYRNELS